MLVAKTSPIGIDWYVQRLQAYLYSELIKAWKIQPSDYTSYGRCYRNRKDFGYIAENYVGGGSYEEVYWKGGSTVMSFFGTAPTITRRGTEAFADVHLVYFADLSKLKPSAEHRADEEVRQDVVSLLIADNAGFHYSGTETGIENVLREYPGSRRDEQLKYIDMHPVHAFRINLKLKFDPSKVC